MSAVTLQPDWPEDWRPGDSATDLRFAQQLVEETMSPYWKKRRMVFSRQLFKEQWLRLDTAIIMREGQTAGLIAWDVEEGIHHLRELHLVAQWRGQGIGGQTLARWIEREEALGAQQMRLKVFAENPARWLYERMGFRVMHNFSDISGLLGMERPCTGQGTINRWV